MIAILQEERGRSQNFFSFCYQYLFLPKAETNFRYAYTHLAIYKWITVAAVSFFTPVRFCYLDKRLLAPLHARHGLHESSWKSIQSILA